MKEPRWLRIMLVLGDIAAVACAIAAWTIIVGGTLAMLGFLVALCAKAVLG